MQLLADAGASDFANASTIGTNNPAPAFADLPWFPSLPNSYIVPESGSLPAVVNSRLAICSQFVDCACLALRNRELEVSCSLPTKGRLCRSAACQRSRKALFKLSCVRRSMLRVCCGMVYRSRHRSMPRSRARLTRTTPTIAASTSQLAKFEGTRTLSS